MRRNSLYPKQTLCQPGYGADIDEKLALRHCFKEALQLKWPGLTFLQAIALYRDRQITIMEKSQIGMS